MKFSIKDFFSKCDQFSADLVTFTEEILNGKLHFLCCVTSVWCELKCLGVTSNYFTRVTTGK